jgi:hypothetical protein
MNLKDITFNICRCYITGLTNQVTSDEKQLLLGWLRSRQIGNLASVTKLLPNALQSADRYRVLLQIEAFFKKNTLFEEGDAEQVALSAFLKAEQKCEMINESLNLQRHRELSGNYRGYWTEDEVFEDLFYQDRRHIKDIIKNVLGDFDTFVDALPKLGYITNGASVTIPRKDAMPSKKVKVSNLTCTGSCAELLDAFSKHWGYGVWFRYPIVDSNRVTFVPKNWKTRRTIACEPVGNMFLQLAFDEYVKVRLKNYLGIDLSNQSWNQTLCREGAVGGEFATIDLQMASDTLAYETVMELLPQTWSHFLSAIRCEHYVAEMANGDVHTGHYHKFSSMGNGATFALESLIFGAITKMCSEVRWNSMVDGKYVEVGTQYPFAVYGDDIIIHHSRAQKSIAWLNYYGFMVNEDKSFLSGPFRESCGVNYYHDQDITPKRLTFEVRGKPGLCHVVNTLSEIASVSPPLAEYLTQLVYKYKLPFVPYNESTISGVWVDPAVDTVEIELKSKKFGEWVPAFRAYVPKVRSFKDHGTTAAFLWHLAVRADREDNKDILKMADPTITSCTAVPLPEHKYGRGLVMYHPDTQPWVITFSVWRSKNTARATKARSS